MSTAPSDASLLGPLPPSKPAQPPVVGRQRAATVGREMRGSVALSKVSSSEIAPAEGMIVKATRRMTIVKPTFSEPSTARPEVEATLAGAITNSRRPPASFDSGDMSDDKAELKQRPSSLESGQLDEWDYPDGGRKAWGVVLGCFILTSCVMGYGMVWGVLMQQMHETKYQSTPLSTLTLVAGVGNFCSLAFSFVGGRLGERYGYKRMIAISCTLTYISIILSAYGARNLPLVFVFQGACLGFSGALGCPLFMSMPSMFFKKKRGIATGIVISGSGVGGAISSLIFRAVVPKVGYSHAFMIYGSMNAVASFGAWFLLDTRFRPRTAQEVQAGPNTSWLPEGIWRDGAFYSVMISVFVGTFGFLSPFYFITSYTRLHCPNIDPNSLLPALPLIAMSLALGLGRVGAGFLADRLGAINTFFMSFLLGGLLQICLWPYATTYGSIMVFSVLFGLTGTWFLSLLPVVCAQLFGMNGLATITGVGIMANAPGQFVGATIAGLILTASGGQYTNVSYYSGAAMTCGGFCILYARFTRQPKLFARF